MRTLIYKRTHCGDPGPTTGVFGCEDCMKGVRGWKFDSVIGIGGKDPFPECKAIAGRLTWIRIGRNVIIDDPSRPFVTPSSPLVWFDHFMYFGGLGKLLKEIAPSLAERMYGPFGPRRLMDSLSFKE
jgi:hypothetical protein